MQTLKDLTSSLHDSASLQRLRDNLNELPKRWLARVEQPETGVLVASAEEKPKDGHLAIVSEPQPSCFQALLIQFEPRRPKASMLPLRSCHRQVRCLPRRIACDFLRRASNTSAPRPLETWEEVELHRPKAPTLEGYVRPVGAPEQLDIPREQYHQFMMGKPARYSVELRNFLMGLGVVSFCFAEFAFTVYKLRPDDLDWVDEERKRAAAAKARIEARIAKQESQASNE
ncbi:hypothetical protein AK812_SmicGene20623 [Symbiodinium microadriaticum]|uniref:Uncharacterized protein n=1 Tax=Symbiodinium microadriaticum TaxID=2951 RepID=A0A1Q9DPK0_SYMMI|nr:hypothetical protein AK812_SmicGene20623 [Symbiodinium microadriaticum]